MKFSQIYKVACRAQSILIILVISLVACSDNKGSLNTGISGEQLSGPTTGKLVDAAISGVNYSTSSEKNGTTDENGNYNYEYGDTVEFKLGSLSLGKVKATAIVTPISLAGNSSSRLQNLLVLLQSLDLDNEPGNGISIPAAAAAAVSAEIDLEGDPDEFVTSSALQSIREKGGIAGDIKTPAEAKAHFLTQGISILSTGIWVRFDNTTATLIRTSVGNNGEYLYGEAVADDPCDINLVCGNKPVSKAGVEYGTAILPELDLRGFKIVGEPIIDTNLQAGLSHLRPNWRIYTDGFELITSDIVVAPRKVEQKSLFGELFHIAKPLKLSSSKEKNKMIVKEVRFSKMENVDSGIVGAWVLDKSKINTQTFLFFSNGNYFMVDPVGDLDRDCGDPGVEFSSYTFDEATKKLNLKGFTYDTNGCAGLSDNEPISFNIDAKGNKATLKMKDNSSYILHRVSG